MSGLAAAAALLNVDVIQASPLCGFASTGWRRRRILLIDNAGEPANLLACASGIAGSFIETTADMGKFSLDLGKRERQLVETVYRLGEASVSEVLKELADPPSYSSVRAMLGQLVEKDVLKHRQEGKRYLYRPAIAKNKARRSALRNLLSTFFAGEPLDAMAALLDISSKDLKQEDLQRMKKLIEQAQQENQS